MIGVDQIKILGRKIQQNEEQYDLDRKAAKISAFSFNNLDKYEYLTGEDLDLKPSTVEQARFEYSPLGKVFNRGLKEEDKKEGLLKILKNIKENVKRNQKYLAKLIKLVGLQKMKEIIIIRANLLFTGFTETLKNFRKGHQGLNTMI